METGYLFDRLLAKKLGKSAYLNLLPFKTAMKIGYQLPFDL